MSEKAASKQKRSKSYYAKLAKKSKYGCGAMDVGLKGFLITCNNREKECLKEAHRLLNEYADKVYGPEDQQLDVSSSTCDDIDEEIKKEVESLKKQNQKKIVRFKSVECGAKNCLFIKTSLPDPNRIVDDIFEDIQEKKTQKSRFILRLLPVSSTCRAFPENIMKSCKDILEEHFKDSAHKFSVLFKARNNGSVGRDEIIQQIAAEIRRLGDSNVADLKSPQVSVSVDVIGKFCFIGILKNYFQMKKYNLVELGAPPRDLNKTEKCEENVKSSPECQQTAAELSLMRVDETSENKEILKAEEGSTCVDAPNCSAENEDVLI